MVPSDCPEGHAEDLSIAAACAVAGGLAARRFYRRDDLGIADKGVNDPVTEADHAANDAILEVLGRRAPADRVRSEESPPSRREEDAERLWVVDPLDGTKEFIARNGEFSVMVGLACRGGARLGAVLQPDPGRLFVGIADEWAWSADVTWEGPTSNGTVRVGAFHPLGIEPEPAGTIRMVRSRSHPDPLITAIGERLGATHVKSGSVGLKCALIAEDGADLYVHPVPFLSEWDTCAPEAVLRGAGGRVSDCRGEALSYGKPFPAQAFGIFAARHAVWCKALPLVREVTSGKLGFDS